LIDAVKQRVEVAQVAQINRSAHWASKAALVMDPIVGRPKRCSIGTTRHQERQARGSGQAQALLQQNMTLERSNQTTQHALLQSMCIDEAG
jgi:hypothetical protein